ncbi:hypothetical protein MMC14_000203 [Varicellaria rhodocarpa]|nr:hypothetical protein [Varicellaria rhodocarpa]
MADQTREVLRQRAIRYLKSHPGSPFDDNNVQVHSYCRKLLNPSNNNFTDPELERMRRALDYRLFNIMQQATAYMTAIMRGMEMPLPRCEDWDSDSFLVPSPLTGKSADIKKYHNTLKTIQDMKLFDDPGEDESLPYDKGVKYMVAVVLRQDWDDEMLVACLEYAKEDFKLKPEQLGGALQEQLLRRRSTIDAAEILNR